jgi:hypothetical protein
MKPDSLFRGDQGDVFHLPDLKFQELHLDKKQSKVRLFGTTAELNDPAISPQGLSVNP